MDKKNPVIASLLSLLTPGLGQIYNGELQRGLILQGFNQFVGVCLYIITPFIVAKPVIILYLIFFIVIVTLSIHIYSIINAYRTAKYNEVVPMKVYNNWYIYVAFLLCFWTIGILVNGFSTWKSYKIPASSMEPTLRIGDHILVSKIAYSKQRQPKRGDVVVFVFPEDKSKDFIKRVIGLPGDTVAISDRQIIVNGITLKEDYVIYTSVKDNNVIRKMDNVPEKMVPEGKYYVLGDNRDKSYDSRFWGFVDNDALIGKAMFIYYARDWNRITEEIH